MRARRNSAAHFQRLEPAAVAGFFVGAAWPHACARLWIHLSPVSPANLRLSPVLPGTVFLNDDKDLHAVLLFVPGVPGKKGVTPGRNQPKPPLFGSSLAARNAGNSSPIGARVHRVLKGWTVDGGHLPPRM